MMNSPKPSLQKIILTGATGFVGKHFLSDFSENYKIETLNLRTTQPEEVNFSRAVAVVHCAALVHQNQPLPDSSYFEINTHLTLNLAKQAKAQGVKQFVYLSTAHVFADSGSVLELDKFYLENSDCHPSTGYAKSKFAAEQELAKLMSEDFKVCIVRPPMVYGHGAKGNILTLAKLIKKSLFLPLGFKYNRRSLIYVKNLTHFIHCCIQSNVSGVFLAQDEKSLSIHEISQTLAQALKVKRIFLPVPYWLLRLLYVVSPLAIKNTINRLFGSLAFDNSKSNQLCNYKPLYTTLAGFQEMLSKNS